MDSEKERGKQYTKEAQAILEAAVDGDKTFEEVDSLLLALAERYLVLAESQSEEDAIRRAALCERDLAAGFLEQSPELRHEFVTELCSIGFPTLQSRVLHLSAFARYCIDRGRPRLALPLIDETSELLQAESSALEQSVREELREIIESTRRALEDTQ